MRWVWSRALLEDRLLDLVDVALDPVDHGLVVVDDRVEHRPDDGDRALVQELRAVLEALARALEVFAPPRRMTTA